MSSKNRNTRSAASRSNVRPRFFPCFRSSRWRRHALRTCGPATTLPLTTAWAYAFVRSLTAGLIRLAAEELVRRVFVVVFAMVDLCLIGWSRAQFGQGNMQGSKRAHRHIRVFLDPSDQHRGDAQQLAMAGM